MLDVIDTLRRAPERIAALIQRRYYGTAVRELLGAQKTADGEDCKGVGALADVRGSLAAVKTALHETIVDDLHRYLYLRSTQCEELVLGEDTAGAVAATSSAASAADGHSSTLSGTASSPIKSTMRGGGGAAVPSTSSKHRRFRSDVVAALAQSHKLRADGNLSAVAADILASRADDPTSLDEDLERAPEDDPLRHIQLMVAALDRLERLEEAVTVVKQRLPLELFKVSEQTLMEVQERWAGIGMHGRTGNDGHYGSVGTMGGGGSPSAALAARMLEDLVQSLSRRLFGIAQIHRFTIQTVMRAIQRSNIDKNGESCWLDLCSSL